MPRLPLLALLLLSACGEAGGPTATPSPEPAKPRAAAASSLRCDVDPPGVKNSFYSKSVASGRVGDFDYLIQLEDGDPSTAWVSLVACGEAMAGELGKPLSDEELAPLATRGVNATFQLRIDFSYPDFVRQIRVAPKTLTIPEPPPSKEFNVGQSWDRLLGLSRTTIKFGDAPELNIGSTRFQPDGWRIRYLSPGIAIFNPWLEENCRKVGDMCDALLAGIETVDVVRLGYRTGDGVVIEYADVPVKGFKEAIDAGFKAVAALPQK